MTENSTYLGDGVTARLDGGYQIELSTDRGRGGPDLVYLGSSELAALIRFGQAHGLIEPAAGEPQ